MPEDVLVWHLSLAPEPAELVWLRALLSDDERERADRFLFERHRRRWTACRAQVRMLLGERAGAEPSSLRFEVGQWGKPALAGHRNVRFNVSHSGEHGLLAISAARPLGVDLEAVVSGRRNDAIAHRYFSAFEVARYRAVEDDSARLRTFYRLWSAKEAYIKAVGRGLSLGLGNFDVSLAPGEPARLAATRPDPAAAGRWRLMELAAPEGFKAALVVANDPDIG